MPFLLLDERGNLRAVFWQSQRFQGCCRRLSVQRYSFGGKSGAEPPKALLQAVTLTNSLLVLIDTFWLNATLHQLCPSSPAMHCNMLTLSAAHFLGGGEMLGQERWGKEQAGGASNLYPCVFCQRLARGSRGLPCRVQRCCWWTGFFCNLCVGCTDSLAEGNL